MSFKFGETKTKTKSVEMKEHLSKCKDNPKNFKEPEPIKPEIKDAFSHLTDLEEVDLKTAIYHWIISYRRNVIKRPTGENAEKMKRMLTYYKRLFGYEYQELKFSEFQEWLKFFYFKLTSKNQKLK